MGSTTLTQEELEELERHVQDIWFEDSKSYEIKTPAGNKWVSFKWGMTQAVPQGMELIKAEKYVYNKVTKIVDEGIALRERAIRDNTRTSEKRMKY